MAGDRGIPGKDRTRIQELAGGYEVGAERTLVFEWIKKKLSFGDAYILAVALKQMPSLSVMITWDKEHFKGKFKGTIHTPAEYLQNRP